MLSQVEQSLWNCGCVVTEAEQPARLTICDVHRGELNFSPSAPVMPVSALRSIDPTASVDGSRFILVDRAMHLMGPPAVGELAEYLPLTLAALAPYADREVPDVIDMGQECRLRIVKLEGDVFSGAMIVFVQTPRLSSALRRAVEMYGLTAREADVLRLTAKSLSNAEIADSMSIVPSTVSDYMRSLFRKMDCTRRTQMLRMLFVY
jgi:DNA-binding CsgD family transcriptional regulator